MIEYMHHSPEGTILYDEEGKKKINHRMPWLIQQWCYEHLMSYDGYLKAVKLHLGYAHRVPLYLCDELMLIPLGRVRDYDMIWINHASVKRFWTEDHRFYIHFVSGCTIEVNTTQKRYALQVKKLEIIRNTKVKHFH